MKFSFVMNLCNFVKLKLMIAWMIIRGWMISCQSLQSECRQRMPMMANVGVSGLARFCTGWLCWGRQPGLGESAGCPWKGSRAALPGMTRSSGWVGRSVRRSSGWAAARARAPPIDTRSGKTQQKPPSDHGQIRWHSSLLSRSSSSSSSHACSIHPSCSSWGCWRS